VNPQVRQIAQAERVRAITKKNGDKPPAPPAPPANPKPPAETPKP